MSNFGINFMGVGQIHSHPPHPNPNSNVKTAVKESLIFDKYIINSAEELAKLNKSGKLTGAFVITGDRKHVGIHKFFYAAQFISVVYEKIRNLFSSGRQLDANLCHGMVVVGWDDKWNEKKQQYNNRPLLAHSVMDGVKLNAVDYFNYEDKDVDHMVVYVPKDQALKDEYTKNAELTAKISTEPKNRSKFSWSHLSTSLFKKQIVDRPTECMQKDLAYAVTDILLERKLSNGSDENQTRAFYCMEYALTILQSSILTKALSNADKHALLFNKGKKLSREEVATRIYSSIQNQAGTDPLAKAYWGSRICSQMHTTSVLSSYASNFFDTMSELKASRNLVHSSAYASG